MAVSSRQNLPPVSGAGWALAVPDVMSSTAEWMKW